MSRWTTTSKKVMIPILRDRHRHCAMAAMNRFKSALLLVATLLTVATAACHNTAQGVKADTRRALDKTGKALERAGDKIDGHRKKDR